jgi:hypothetical protein
MKPTKSLLGSVKISMKQKLTLSAMYVCSSVVEDRQFELAKALGVGDHVDLDDLPEHDREAECCPSVTFPLRGTS